ncbi:hypothetical protein [Tropicibacter oceani]|uniref:Uncharacterized protein n=1 Tax=Tropicibacter oceani TaxID=3058420 RepID=A0ABY8QGD1_9RHOB|nr:hypothetical protein [Tropicibacter oceani]WGW03686.1 hypothetical protein QF118_17475 [Tropicibacter oceani]
MTRSANEIMGLAQKAASGAGFPPEQAARFGQAAVAYLAAGQPPDALLTALRDPADSPLLRLPLLMDDVLRALSLTGPEVELTLHPGDEALATAYARLLPLRMTACTVVEADGEAGQARLRVAADTDTPARLRFPPRIEAPQSLIEALGQLAARTYVPASEASRLAGAGAGNIDND